MEVPNLTEEVVLVGGFLVDADGHQTDDGFACYRMIYVFGQPPTVRLVGPEGVQVLVTDQVIRVNSAADDGSAIDVTLTLPPLDVYQGRELLVYNQGPGNTFINTTPPDIYPDGSTSYELPAGSTIRITAGGIYSA